MKLVAHDELQWSPEYAEDWKPIKIVEAEKPEHPQDKKDREWREHGFNEPWVKNFKLE